MGEEESTMFTFSKESEHIKCQNWNNLLGQLLTLESPSLSQRELEDVHL